MYTRTSRAIFSKISRVLTDAEATRSNNESLEENQPDLGGNLEEKTKVFSVLYSVTEQRFKDTKKPLQDSGSELSESFLRILSREFSSFGFLCHLFQAENRKLDIRSQDVSSPLHAKLIFRFHMLTLSQPGAGFQRKFVSDQIRQIGILERGNLRFGCIKDELEHGNPQTNQSRSQESSVIDHVTDYIKDEVEHDDNKDDDDENDLLSYYSDLVYQTAQQYGLDLV